MRKLLLIGFLAVIGLGVKAQTTQQEYNYCRNTYAKAAHSGYNILSGYKAVNYYKESKESDPVKVVLFNKLNDKTQAVMIIVQNQKVPLTTIVLPVGNDDLWEQTLTDFRNLSAKDKNAGDAAALTGFTIASDLLRRLDEKDGLK